MSRRIYGTLIFVVACVFLTSTFLFRLNGGFGGGHGRFDEALFYLALPWIFLIGRLPDAIWSSGDYVPFVLLPLVFNLLALLIVKTVQRRISKPSPTWWNHTPRFA